MDVHIPSRSMKTPNVHHNGRLDAPGLLPRHGCPVRNAAGREICGVEVGLIADFI